jgi:hypothetical protein
VGVAGEVSVKNGEFRRDPRKRGCDESAAVHYGDLDRDGIEEAVVHTACNSGGSGEFTQVFVYEARAARPSPWRD